MAASAKPGKVPAEVLAYLLKRKARGSFSHLDVYNEEHAEAFAVAKAMESDVVDSIKSAVTEALEEGLPFEAFQKRLTPILADKGWWGRKTQIDPITNEEQEVQLGSSARLRLIYQTNIRTARAAGQWERIQKTKKFLPKLRYRHGHPERPRPEHVAWDGTVLPVDDPWWDTHLGQNGYGCTCYVEQVPGSVPTTGEDSIDRDLIEVRNKRTGQTVKTARGVDPSFAFNPGKVRPSPGELPPDPTTVVRVPKAKAKPRAKPSAKAFAQYVDSWERGDNSRKPIRALLATIGLTDDHRRPTDDSGADRVLIEDQTAYGAAATLGWDGTMHLAPETHGAIQDAIQQLRANEPVYGLRVQAMGTPIHEEIHAYGSITSRNYSGANAAVEEVSTEVLSRKIVREVFAQTASPKNGFLFVSLPGKGESNATVGLGAYTGAIRRVVDALDDVTGGQRPIEELHQLLEETSLRFKQTVETTFDLTRLWADSTQLPQDQRDRLYEVLRRLSVK